VSFTITDGRLVSFEHWWPPKSYFYREHHPRTIHVKGRTDSLRTLGKLVIDLTSEGIACKVSIFLVNKINPSGRRLKGWNKQTLLEANSGATPCIAGSGAETSVTNGSNTAVVGLAPAVVFRVYLCPRYSPVQSLRKEAHRLK